ncbi:MAG: hypothetical protein EOO65_02860 [Methanosarcinales archaeon]|nr:MAG: hypothetical protein EOO65_02860 [Methanosarcinales archaeon]
MLPPTVTAVQGAVGDVSADSDTLASSPSRAASIECGVRLPARRSPDVQTPSRSRSAEYRAVHGHNRASTAGVSILVHSLRRQRHGGRRSSVDGSPDAALQLSRVHVDAGVIFPSAWHPATEESARVDEHDAAGAGLSPTAMSDTQSATSNSPVALRAGAARPAGAGASPIDQGSPYSQNAALLRESVPHLAAEQTHSPSSSLAPNSLLKFFRDFGVDATGLAMTTGSATSHSPLGSPTYSVWSELGSAPSFMLKQDSRVSFASIGSGGSSPSPVSNAVHSVRFPDTDAFERGIPAAVSAPPVVRSKQPSLPTERMVSVYIPESEPARCVRAGSGGTTPASSVLSSSTQRASSRHSGRSSAVGSLGSGSGGGSAHSAQRSQSSGRGVRGSGPRVPLGTMPFPLARDSSASSVASSASFRAMSMHPRAAEAAGGVYSPGFPAAVHSDGRALVKVLQTLIA